MTHFCTTSQVMRHAVSDPADQESFCSKWQCGFINRIEKWGVVNNSWLGQAVSIYNLEALNADPSKDTIFPNYIMTMTELKRVFLIWGGEGWVAGHLKALLQSQGSSA